MNQSHSIIMTRITRWISLGIFCGFTTAALPAATQEWLLVGATVHTISGPTLAPGRVHIRDGRIVSVGPELESATAERVDLGGLHVYPGLIAASSSLGLQEIDSVRATLDQTESGTYTPDVRSWVAVNPDSELIPVARANGITHFQPVPFGGIVSGSSAVMSTAGWTTEEMKVREPVALHLDWPSLSLNTTPKEEFKDKSRWKSLEDQAKDRRARLKELDEFFSEAEAYAKARREAPQTTSITPAWEAMRPVVEGELPLMIHATTKQQIDTALEWARQRGYRVILAEGRDAWMVAKELAQARVPVVYDHVFALPAYDHVDQDTHFRAPGLLHEAGVMVAFSQGGRHEASSLRNLPYAAAQAVAYGLPKEEALKGLTLYPARMLGVEDRLGSIEPGKEATLIAVEGEILDIRSQVRRMWIRGAEVSLESRHTRLYEKYRARPTLDR